MNIKEILRKLKKIYIYFTSTHAYYKGIKLSDSHCEYLAHFIADKMNADCDLNKIALFSASSLPEILRLERRPIKIFYTIENVHVFESYWERWENLHLQKYAPALSVGFDYCDHPRYVRFPYWLERPLGAYATKEGIAKFVREHNYSNFTNRTKACAFICRMDYFGDRAQMADLVAQVMPMSYPSDFRHNDDDMQGKFNDDKIAYLRQFKFNLCPENSNNKGYVTEKIFEAIQAGCVPIYWGNEGYPEPEILSPKAIVYLDKEHPEDGLALLRKLYEDPKAYEEFASQPRFMPGAEEKIYAYYEQLETKLREVLK